MRALKLNPTGHGPAGLEIVRKTPRLILLDMMLPGISGNKVCTELKADQGTEGIPVILLTRNLMKSTT